VLLRDGRIEQVGSPQEIFERPRSAFVAGFIGTPPMNLMEMTMHRLDDGQCELRGGGGSVRVDARRFALDGRERVTLGVRPAHLRIDTEAGRDGGFAGEVLLVEYLGNEVLVSVGQGSEEIAVLLPSAGSPRLGERLHVVADAQQVHLFDVESGASLLRSGTALH
jgi:ABC-type sugar transport system ATPase subunit